MVKSPASPKNQGFLPLHSNSHGNMNRQPGRLSLQDEHIVNIPLTPIITNASTGARKEGQTITEYPRGEGEGGGVFHGHIGRRKARDETARDSAEEEGALTTMGKFYDKVLHFSVITRYTLYILPLSLCFLVPILVSIYAAPRATIGGVRMLWLFVWVSDFGLNCRRSN
jgi:hypothetical protein